MSHRVLRLTNSLFSQPLLMTKDSCEEVANYLDKRNSATFKELTDIAKADFGGFEDTTSQNVKVEGVGIIPIAGPISTYKTGFEALCQNTSYESIIEQAEAFASDESIQTVVLDLRSGGGMAHKAFEMSALLKEIIENSGKRLVSYIDQSACSAAYILASVAEEVIINNTASAGSIGVLIELQSNAKQLEKAGIERKFVTSSDGKIPFAEDGTFREEFIEGLQESVDTLYKDFIGHVQTHRGLSEKTIRGTNAGVYSAEKSLELGLVDKIMTTKEFYDYLAETSSASTPKPVSAQVDNKTNGVNKMAEEVITPEAATVEPSADMIAKFAEMQAALDAQSAQLASYQKQEQAAKQTELEQRLDSTGFLAECKEDLVGFFMSDKTDEVTKTLMSTVIDKAEASNKEVKTLAEADVAEAVTQKDAAEARAEKAEKEAVDAREEFGNKEQQSDDSTITTKDSISREASLGAWVEKQKSNQSK